MCQKVNLTFVEPIQIDNGNKSKCPFGYDRIPGSGPRPLNTLRKTSPKNKKVNLVNKQKPVKLEIVESKETQSSKSININTGLLQNKGAYRGDILAELTHYTGITFSLIGQGIHDFKSSTVYKILTRTTQPAHVISLLIMSAVIFILWPNIFGVKTVIKERNMLPSMVYLGAFATHFGAQIWMTFVSGLALYFALPRHTFGLCQQILFPKYYGLGSALSILTLIMFVKTSQTTFGISSIVQVTALALCSIIELTIRLYLTPPLLVLMRAKHAYESRIGSGQEVGHLAQGELVNSISYQQVHKSFRRIHMIIAIGNIMSLLCTFVHLSFLASKINI